MNFLQSLTAKTATPAKEKKNLTAKAAEDAKETIFKPIPEENAKTSPSLEWSRARRRWTLVNLVVDHPGVAITSLGAVLADLGLNLLCSLRVLGGEAFLPCFGPSASSAVKLFLQ